VPAGGVIGAISSGVHCEPRGEVSRTPGVADEGEDVDQHEILASAPTPVLHRRRYLRRRRSACRPRSRRSCRRRSPGSSCWRPAGRSPPRWRCRSRGRASRRCRRRRRGRAGRPARRRSSAARGRRVAVEGEVVGEGAGHGADADRRRDVDPHLLADAEVAAACVPAPAQQGAAGVGEVRDLLEGSAAPAGGAAPRESSDPVRCGPIATDLLRSTSSSPADVDDRDRPPARRPSSRSRTSPTPAAPCCAGAGTQAAATSAVGQQVWINISTTIRVGAVAGSLANNFTLDSDAPGLALRCSGASQADRSTSTATATPPRRSAARPATPPWRDRPAVSSKTIQGTCDGSSVATSAGTLTGGALKYRLRVQNPGSVPMQNSC